MAVPDSEIPERAAGLLPPYEPVGLPHRQAKAGPAGSSSWILRSNWDLMGVDGMAFCLPSLMASSFSNVSHSYQTGNKYGVTLLSLGSRIMKEKSIVSWRGAKFICSKCLK